MRSGRRWSSVATTCIVALLVAVPLTSSPSVAIVGGQPSPEGAHPFMASLQTARGSAFCGGTVIAPNWVLTAGHCVDGRDPGELFVVTGRRDLSETHVGQTLEVAEISVHDDYGSSGFYDAALVRLAEPTVSPAIALAGEADDDFEAAGTPVKATGWGDTLPTLGVFSSEQLREVDLEVVSDSKCEQTNGPAFDFQAATGVCAAAFLKDSCNGDSGGPLFASRSGLPVQIGIVSYGLSCGVPEFPGVYTEVNNPDIRAWIAATAAV